MICAQWPARSQPTVAAVCILSLVPCIFGSTLRCETIGVLCDLFHQPFRLEFFSTFNQITRDVDAVLPSLLQNGVSTGVQASIPPSQVWIQHVPSVDLASQLVSHFDNCGQLQITPT